MTRPAGSASEAGCDRGVTRLRMRANRAVRAVTGVCGPASYDRTMRTRWKFGGWGALFVVGLACSFGLEYAEPCLNDGECASESCHWGICVRGTCSGNSGCGDGWTCIDPPPSSNGVILDALFGQSDPEGHCALECDGCPEGERYSCDSVCVFDHEPHVDAGGPYQARVGEPITLSGAVELVEGREVALAEWDLGYAAESSEPIVGLTPTHTFARDGRFELTLRVEDSGEQKGSAVAELHVCHAMGEPCASGTLCCDDGFCDDGLCAPQPVCGNGIVEHGELCDTDPPEGQSCLDFEGHDGGELGCSDDCNDADLSSCDTCGVTFDNCSDDADCCPGYSCGSIGWCS
jgi:hypothetical protein